MNRLRSLILCLAVAAPLAAQDTGRAGGVRVGMNFGVGRPRVAVLPIAGQHGDSLRTMIQRNLDYGNRVEIFGHNPADLPLVEGTPNFEVFTTLGIAYIVQGSVIPSGELHVALFQVSERRPIQVRNFPLDAPPLSGDWRMAVHRASDEVELWATGVRGIAATRIAFVRDNRVWLVDSDGANPQPVEGTAGGRSPAWHPSGRYIAFAMLPGADAGGISIRDLWAGTTKRVTRTVNSGSFGSPVFSPDGAFLAYSFAEDGGDIFRIDPFVPGTPTRITFGRNSVNTSPTFSPDGRRFAFATGRSGRPDVYISGVDGSDVELLTDGGFGDRTYRANPAWSPDGRYIAVQSQLDGRFQITLIAPRGRQEQVLTSEGENEDPSWAPDGRHIVFTSTRGGSRQLWVLDTESSRTRQLTRGPAAQSSAWSGPLLPREIPQ